MKSYKAVITLTVTLIATLITHAYAMNARPNTEQNTPYPVTSIHTAITSQTEWLNTSHALTAEDLQGRIILLDFWTYCCINCIHIMPDLAYLEEKFGDKLTVIGVHSAKFANERETENIREAIMRYRIKHAVVNDDNFKIWSAFGVRAWPTLVLIGPNGHLVQAYSGEGNREAIEQDIEALLDQYQEKVNTKPLPYEWEVDKELKTVLNFPGKLAYADDKQWLFISDSNNDRIIATDIKGNIQLQIGSGHSGNKDGNFKTAQFNQPQGILYHENTLYIADTENHTLRKADLETKHVTTIAGTGLQGQDRTVQQQDALATPLSSPWDLAFYPNPLHIAIAMAGTHQLWTYDIENQTVSVLAGNGRESIDDGAYPYNSLSQPSGLSVYDNKLYFVDSETSSLRVLENGEITTLIGTGLFDFGYEEGNRSNARMQHSIGVHADHTGIYIADTYNHAVRRYDPKTGILKNMTEQVFNEPNDIIKIGDSFYIADTNNHSIKTLQDETIQELPIIPKTKTVVTYIEELLNVERLPLDVVAPDSTIIVSLKPGWKINDLAPSYIAMFQNKELIEYVEKEPIQTANISLNNLLPDQTYTLQSIIYYCEDKENSLCLIKAIEKEIKVKNKEKNRIEIKIN